MVKAVFFLSGLFMVFCCTSHGFAQQPDDVPVQDEGKIIEDINEYVKMTPVWLGQPRHVWYLKFEHEKPKMVVVGREFGRTEIYWYMLYKVTNLDTWEHEVFLEVTAWSDKGVEYQDYYARDVIEAIEKKENRTEANGGKGLYTADVVAMAKEVPDKLAEHPKPGVHADDTGLAVPKIGPGETWECVAVFKRLSEPEADRFRINVKGLKSWDPEANFIRIRVAGLSNDFKIVTHEDMKEIATYLGKDCLILTDGSKMWGKVTEAREEYSIITTNEAGEQIEEPVSKSKVFKWVKSDKSSLLPNERLVDEPYYEILYTRKSDEFASTEDPIEFVEEGWVRHWRIIQVDQVFTNDFKEFREGKP
ncbi:MAG: hypothetical protein N2234_03415 [Planctomycetota bacterium]|nr:hypothetical protein [Planctomycetota bacterium]